jgi:phosphopantetheinyl transferase
MMWLDGAQTGEPIARFTDEAVEIVVAGLDVAPQSVRTLFACLSADERQRARRFLFDRDRSRHRSTFFSRRENAAYQALDPRDKPIAFFNCWTRKEAFIKALGDGLYHPLDRFDVSLAPGEPARILRVDDTPGEACGWRLESFCPAPGFVAAVVTEDDDRDLRYSSLVSSGTALNRSSTSQ